MLIDSRLLKKISYSLAVFSGIVAYNLSFQNSKRAARGCGEYGPEFVYADAFDSAILLCIPSVVLLFMILTAWNRASYKFASFTVALVYLGIVIHEFAHGIIFNYSPCDRKGDEQSVAIFIIGIFGIPLLWGVLMLSAEATKFISGLIFRPRGKK